MPERLPPKGGQVIDQASPIEFFYQGKSITGFSGESVASALIANGIQVFARSFKYHRPRGPQCMGGQCGRCAMTVNGRPNVRTCQTPLTPGLEVEPQGATKCDPLAFADKASNLMPVGFYYKNFYRPSWIWPPALKVMQKAGGGAPKLGKVETSFKSHAVHISCEVLVIGAGPAGMRAALDAAKAGARTVLVEAEPRLGGMSTHLAEGNAEIIHALADETEQETGVRKLLGATCHAVYPEGVLLCSSLDFAERRETVYQIRPRAVIFATGFTGRPMLFAHNDRPQVMLPEAVHKLAAFYGLPMEGGVVVAGGDSLALGSALYLAALGIKVNCVADYREKADPELAAWLAERGIPFFPGYAPAMAEQSGAGLKVTLSNPDGDSHQVETGMLAASGGRSPRLSLLRAAGFKMRHDPDLNLFAPKETPPGFFAAGGVRGFTDTGALVADGSFAAAEALAHLGMQAELSPARVKENLAGLPGPEPSQEPPMLSPKKGKTFVCYCHDVSLKDVHQAAAEGFDEIEKAKRYTTATMGPCQGGMCGDNFAGLTAKAQGDDAKSRRLTTPRPFARPASLGVLAAGYHEMTRRTPLHQIQKEQGGKPFRTGPWLRIEDFGKPEEESLSLHRSAGLVDVSTLGKFRIFGPDAKKLLNRIYVKPVDGLEPGKILYNLACNEEGVPIDDGAIILRGENDYLLTTSTARAGFTPAWFSRWLREEDWQVHMVDLSDALAGMNLAGPRARDILLNLTDEDISNQTLPYLSWADVEIAGVKALVMRLGFLGELSFELTVKASEAEHLWRAICESGKDYGLAPGGLETQFICRLEKGHALPGLDIDGNTTLFESGLSWVWPDGRSECVGGPMLKLLKAQEARQGIAPFGAPGRSKVEDGFILLGPEGRRKGFVTSCRYSPLLDQTIGLVLVEDMAWLGDTETMTLAGKGEEIIVQRAGHAFYDAEGERLRA